MTQKNEQNLNDLNEYKVRNEKLNKILGNGINPYPKNSSRTHEIKNVLDNFTKIEKSDEKITLAGRLRSIRLHGGSCFANLEDGSGKMQIYFKKDDLGENNYAFFTDSFDIGDFIQAEGILFKTKRGEMTLLVSNFKLLSKSLLPLPDKWAGLNDIEIRFRKRYLDMLSNPEVKEIFKTRSLIIQFIRNYLHNFGFIEVDTPILQQVASGAIAKPFTTRHKALDMDLYLRIAPEIYLKQLVIGGFEKVFEIARCFRNEGIDYSHNPEFTQVEFYWAYKDYGEIMDFMEKFILEMVVAIKGKTIIEYDGKSIDFKGPYPRLDFRQALIDESGVDLDEHNVKSLQKIAKQNGLPVLEFWGKGKLADELYKKFVRPNLISPTYIINHPIELSPLAKKIEGRPNYVERFQLIIGGRIELLNAFSELNDPNDQEQRFKEQSKLAESGDEEAMHEDDEYVEALKYGMPPTAGLGMGIDRLVNVLTNTHNIKEVILFPTMKQENHISINT